MRLSITLFCSQLVDGPRSHSRRGSHVKKANTTQYCKAVSMHTSYRRPRICAATHGQPLGIIRLVGRKQRSEGVVSGDNEAGKVGQEGAAEVQDDQEEVEGAQAKHRIGLGHRRLLLEVGESGVFGELRHRLVRIKPGSLEEVGSGSWAHLFVELRDVVLDAILRRRHGCVGELES